MRAIRALQHQSSLGAQQKSDQASAAVRRRPSQIPPPVERDSINTATQPPAMASSGLQQLKSRRSLPTMGRNTPPPSSRTIGVRRGRAASCDRPCDRPSPRSTSWPRYQSPFSLWREYRNHSGLARSRNLRAPATVQFPFRRNIGAPAPAASVHYYRRYTEPEGFGSSRRNSSLPRPSPEPIRKRAYSVREYSQCPSVEQQSRGEGGWSIVGIRPSNGEQD